MIDKFVGDCRFLSNFYPAKVKWEGIVHLTVEHAFQAAKTFDQESRREIARLREPSRAKHVGRRVTLRPDWEVVKVPIMRSLVFQKFTVHERLRVALLDTGDAELVEGNTWGDIFWGTVSGEGENMLGLILMETRSALRVMAGLDVEQPRRLFERP